MNIVIGVLTHNVITGLRLSLLEETVHSLRRAFVDAPLLVFDNGSVDGTAEVVAEQFGGICYESKDENHTPGRGRNILMSLLQRPPAVADFAAIKPDDLVVLSDDDMRWKPEAGDVLTRFWSEALDDIALDDVALVSGLLEPIYDWNTPRGVVESGGVKALWRDSAPAAAWCFPARHWDIIGPLREQLDGIGEDYHACLRIRGKNMRVCQLDLAEHLGAGLSTWGNVAGDGKPLDREKWGI